MDLWSNIGITLLCVSVFEDCKRQRKKQKRRMSMEILLNNENQDQISKYRKDEISIYSWFENIKRFLKFIFTLIKILGVSKGSFEISFQITGTNSDEIQQQIKNKPAAKQFLNEYCNGQVEYVAYFDNARTAGGNQAKDCTGVALSSDDLNPQFNMSWDNLPEKEQRGPPYHRYDYYFPKGCYGLGLKVKNYGNDDWIKMDGNANEWRILYHGTNNFAINQIVKNNLKPGQNNVYANDDCIDEFGKTVKVGDGIYFSDRISVCIKEGYANYTQVGDKQFAVIFMSRVNPKKIRQSDRMKSINYFVVNESKDVRPYRILLHENK